MSDYNRATCLSLLLAGLDNHDLTGIFKTWNILPESMSIAATEIWNSLVLYVVVV